MKGSAIVMGIASCDAEMSQLSYKETPNPSYLLTDSPSNDSCPTKRGIAMNQLFFGDNLKVLRNDDIPASSVDLIYLDPPFNSDARYNVLFQTPEAERASAQAEAFRDT